MASAIPSGSSLSTSSLLLQKHRSSSPNDFAFITHSQEGLRNNLPPSIDNAGLARRRRRRTSQHDQAILEEEYRRCDKPDKGKRREIAARVDMGEKEVQIWFQNKRQSARRKLKPLLPQDVIPALRSSTPPSQLYPGKPSSFMDHQEPSSNLENSDINPTRMVSSQISLNSQSRSGAQSAMRLSDGKGYRKENSTKPRGRNLAITLGNEDIPSLKPPSNLFEEKQIPVKEYLPFPGSRQSGRNMMYGHTRPKGAIYSDVPLGNHGERETSSQKGSLHCGALPAIQRDTPHHNPRRTNSNLESSDYRPPTLLKRSSSLLRLLTNLEGKAEIVPLEAGEPTLPPPLHKDTTPSALQSNGGSCEAPYQNLADSIRRGKIESKVWEYACDHQATLHNDSNLGSKHVTLEPDEAGVALGIGISRARTRENTFHNCQEHHRTPFYSTSHRGHKASDVFMPITKIKASDSKAAKRKNPKKTPSTEADHVSVSDLKIRKTQIAAVGPSIDFDASARKRAYIEILDENQTKSEASSTSKVVCAVNSPPPCQKVVSSQFIDRVRASVADENYFIGDESDKENHPKKSALHISGKFRDQENSLHRPPISGKNKRSVSKDGKWLVRKKSSSVRSLSRVGFRKAYHTLTATMKKSPQKKLGSSSITSSNTSSTSITKKRKVLEEIFVIQSTPSSITNSSYVNRHPLTSTQSLTRSLSPTMSVTDKISSASCFVDDLKDNEQNRKDRYVSDSHCEKDVDLEKSNTEVFLHEVNDDLGGAELLLSLRGGKWR